MRDETLSSWIKGNVNALHFSGCVPKAIVPDQPKPVATKADGYEPEIHPIFIEFSEHYKTTIFPARPRRPKDKAKVEVGVLIAKRWILARLRNKVFYSLGEMNEAIKELVEMMNQKPKIKSKKSRREDFEEFDKPYALTLPDHQFVVSEWKKVCVNIDHHVEFEQHFYSVPYLFIRQRLDVRVTDTMVEILKKDQRVALHQRSYRQNDFTALLEHRPPSHQKYLEWTPEKILAGAKKLGPDVDDLIVRIMASRRFPEQAYRSCLGIIRLEKRYTKDRLNAACKRAVVFNILTYQGVRTILIKKLDEQSLSDHHPTPSKPSISHDNIRGAAYYSTQTDSKKITLSF